MCLEPHRGLILCRCDTFLLYMLVIFWYFEYIAFINWLSRQLDGTQYRSLAHCYSQSFPLNSILRFLNFLYQALTVLKHKDPLESFTCMTSLSFSAVWHVHMNKTWAHIFDLQSKFSSSTQLSTFTSWRDYALKLEGECADLKLKMDLSQTSMASPLYFLSWISEAAFFSGSFRITCFVQPPWNDRYALCYIVRYDEQEKENHSKHRETRSSPCHL